VGITRRQHQRITQGQLGQSHYWLVGIGGVFVLVGALALVTWGAVKLTDPTTLPIKAVHIQGEFQRLRPEILKARVAQAIKGGFFTTEVDRIRTALLQEPWIREALVRRVWPETLEVTVHEQRAVARWGDKGLLSPQGTVFSPPPESYPKGLVELHGPRGTEAQVLSRFYAINQRLVNRGWKVARLSLSPRRAWSFELVHGPRVIVGRTDFERRIGRFVANFHRVVGDRGDMTAQVDLRYTNGFTVKTRSYGRSG
jgi:cell division protein FtsQ